MTIRQIMSTVFTLSGAILVFSFTVGCEAPEGIDLKAKDWALHVPIGTAKFETESGGFSLSQLKAEEIQNYLGDDFDGEVYDGKGTAAKETAGQRIFVKAGTQGNQIDVDGNIYQTYLVHYPVPLGVEDVKEEMNESFNKSLDSEIETATRQLSDEYGGREDGFLEEPPADNAITIPIKVNAAQQSSSQNREAPIVTGLTNLVYHVKLTFKPGALPKIDGAEITSDNKSQFLSWVKFKYNAGEYVSASSIILPSEAEGTEIILEPNQIAWVSAPTDFATLNRQDEEILNIKFDLLPKFDPPGSGNSFTFTRGILYKPDLDVYNFDAATIKFADGKKEHLGSTGAFNDMITMLGGAEFQGAWMYLFTNTALNQLTVYAEEANTNANVNIFSGSITQSNLFNHKTFYKNADETTAQPIISSGIKVLTDDLLRKNAPKYELYYRIPAQQPITVSSNTKVDVAILIPLRFKVEAGEGDKDAKLVTGKKTDPSTNQTVEKQYIKLYVEQLDDMFGSNNSDSFDLKDKTKDFGSLKKAEATLKVKNNVLPDEFNIGLRFGEETDDSNNRRPLYSDIINMGNDADSKIDIDTTLPEIRMPHPALLLESDNASANFEIEPVVKEDDNAEKDISVRIIGDIVVDFNYKL